MSAGRIGAKQRREQKLLMALQSDHGYMFTELPRESDRYSMMFRRNRITGKSTLTPARKMIVAAPDASWLAMEFERIRRQTPSRRIRKRSK